MIPSHGTARRALRGAILGSLLVLLGACSNSGISGSGGSAATSGSPSAPQPRTVAVGANPQTAALDPATHTLYADDAPENLTDGEVSVINASTCNALQASGCGINNTPEVQVGYRPVTIAVDQATDTIYVVNSADNTVSVINGATCNAQNTSGCSHTPPTVKVGSNPVDVSLDQATDTVYVANWGNGTGTTVSVIDGRTCNGQVTSGCGQIPATVTIGTAPAGVVVDEPTDTVYAATVAPSGAEAVWVIDGATCNATTTSGCGQKPAVGDRRRRIGRLQRRLRDRPGHPDAVRRELEGQHAVDDRHGHLQRDGHLRLRPDPARGAGRQRPGRDRAQPRN